jgi:myo-inositol-1(or 4)-monophosphatase
MREVRALTDFAIELAHGAGDIIMRHFVAGSATVSHKGAIDLVTNADQESEAFVMRGLARRFPEHAVVGEESGFGRRDGPYRWVCDPLDGTTNFAHGVGHFAVLLAVQKRLGPGRFATVVGVTFDPVRGELFVAREGGGATLNGKPLHVSKTTRLIEALSATGFGYDRLLRDEDNHHEFCRMNLVTQGTRRMGAAGLDLAYVAAGRWDVFWEYRLKPWDLCGGVLLVREAGGKVTGLAGGALDEFEGSLLSTNGKLHRPALAALRTARDFPCGDRQALLPHLPKELQKRLKATRSITKRR